jgi:hypothetical protein
MKITLMAAVIFITLMYTLLFFPLKTFALVCLIYFSLALVVGEIESKISEP